jgi:taurine dioxygenase
MTAALDIVPTGQACGATVRGVDLAAPLSAQTVAAIRAAWLEHHVLVFPDQPLSDDNLEAFTLHFGGFGDDPFIQPIDGRDHIIAVHRAADEEAPVFAEAWHTDWSFQEKPPAGTCLLSKIIPPSGGDTLYANQHAALDAMPADLRARLKNRMAIHSAGSAYGPDGVYGTADAHNERAMRIIYSPDADKTHLHPVIRNHPESGRPGLFGCAGYIKAIDGLEVEESWNLVVDLLAWQTREEFQYRHRWEQDMLVMWDNRSVLHMATSGYDGHERLLHRTTIAARDAA